MNVADYLEFWPDEDERATVAELLGMWSDGTGSDEFARRVEELAAYQPTYAAAPGATLTLRQLLGHTMRQSRGGWGWLAFAALANTLEQTLAEGPVRVPTRFHIRADTIHA